jgi:hypothetical protein
MDGYENQLRVESERGFYLQRRTVFGKTPTSSINLPQKNSLAELGVTEAEATKCDTIVLTRSAPNLIKRRTQIPGRTTA